MQILAEGKPFSGYLLYKLVVLPTAEANSIPRGVMQPPALKKYQLRANIYQGKGLAAAGIHIDLALIIILCR